MIEDLVFETMIDLMALMAEAIGQPRSVIPPRPSWYRLQTEVRHIKKCVDHVPFGTRAYLVRDDGTLILIEKARVVFPYTVTVGGKERPTRGGAAVYFTTQPGVEGLTIEECLVT